MNHSYQPHSTNGHGHAHGRSGNLTGEENKPALETTQNSFPDAQPAEKKKDVKEKEIEQKDLEGKKKEDKTKKEEKEKEKPKK